MDAIELLKHDHRMVEQLLRDYNATGGPPGGDEQRRGVVEIMVRELSKHAALEEVLFYPLAKQLLAGDGADAVDRSLEVHASVKTLLHQLDNLSAGDSKEAELMAQLGDAARRHITDDEQQLMPLVRDAADERALTELGDEIDKAKSTAPTRPHPHAPDEPPVLTMAAPVVAIYDRLRDRLQGRPKT